MVPEEVRIHPAESAIIGHWVDDRGGALIADEAAKRISTLMSSYLIEVGRSGDGWSVLYRDPMDGRLWLLSYPDSSVQGGGAPRLDMITPPDALKLFNVAT